MDESALRRLRTAKGTLTTAQLATGIHRGTLSAYERGLKIPDIDNADRIGAYLGVDGRVVRQLALMAREERLERERESA